MRGTLPKCGEKSIPVLIRWADPKVNVFGERGGTVENAGLSTDQKILDTLISQDSEKVCDHGLPGNSPEAAPFATSPAAPGRGEPPALGRLVGRLRFSD